MKKKVSIIIIALILFIGGLTIGFLLNNDGERIPERGNDTSGLTEDSNAQDIGTPGGIIGSGTADSISIPGFEKMTIPANQKTVPCDIFNPEYNPCYFVAVITLDGGAEIYRSGLIAPGKAIYQLTLAAPLDKGEYPATLTYYCYSLNDKTELNGATTHFILEVT
ncbi:MAG: hypothetical protein E7597_03970 [Ruminococcaceae bacterium]|nr:hypothetical protein [Oscillospiraceae bacterium]